MKIEKCEICKQTLGNCLTEIHLRALQQGQKNFDISLKEIITIDMGTFRESCCPSVSGPYIDKITGREVIDVRPVRYTRQFQL